MHLNNPFKIHLLIMALVLVACNDQGNASVSKRNGSLQLLNAGYSILHNTLRDEQYLRTIRLAKSILSFKSISEPTKRIIDDIAKSSSTALEELEELSLLAPEIIYDIEKDGKIEQTTRNALRTTTAMEFLTSKEDFEVLLLVSQTQALRYISHLAKELHAMETNSIRKNWLAMLSEQYEKLYIRVISRLKIARRTKASEIEAIVKNSSSELKQDKKLVNLLCNDLASTPKHFYRRERTRCDTNLMASLC